MEGIYTSGRSYRAGGIHRGCGDKSCGATGKDISTMDIESAPKVTKMYNKTICDELGITVPDDYEAIEE